MKNESKIINDEDNKSEIDNIIMPTGNYLFLNNKVNKDNNNYYYALNNIKSKISLNNNINNNIFSNIVLKDLIIENKKNNLLQSKLNKKTNYNSEIRQNKTFKLKNNSASNICLIKKNTLKFCKNRIIKAKEELSKRYKKRNKKLYRYNLLQKKIIRNNKIPNIKDLTCENNSFSIHLEKKKDNLSNLSNNINLQIIKRFYSPKGNSTIIQEKYLNLFDKRKGFIYKKKLNNNQIDNNYKEINDLFNKNQSSPSYNFYFSNTLTPQNSILNISKNLNKDFSTLINYISNSTKNNFQYNRISNKKSLLNEYNNISDIFHTKKGVNYNINNNLSMIENNKNDNSCNNKHLKRMDYNANNSKILIRSSSLLINENKIYKNKNKRVKSSFTRHNKYNLEYISSFEQKKLLDTKFINLKNYKIKENIISNILADIQDNKSLNNNVVSQLYKRPLINIYTLLELKNNDINK